VLLLVACNSSSERDDSDTTPVTITMPTAPTSATMTMTPTSDGTTDLTGGEGTTVAPGTSTSTGPDDPTSSSSTGTPSFDLGGGPDVPFLPEVTPQLWYSVDNLLVYIELDPLDGSVVKLVTNTINNNPSLAGNINSCGLTMLEDGSLLGSRGNEVGTRFFHIPNPPTVAGSIDVDILGSIPGMLYIEALHTDCDGRVYLMDTGEDNVNNVGNRLLRFNNDYLGGKFNYDVITDLEVAVSVDIDDMAPGIDAGGQVIDNPGFGIDSGAVYALDYTDGTGVALGMAGTYGIHALGSQLFADAKSRLYVLDIDANLFEANPTTLALSPVLATGPALMDPNAPPGNTGLAGPLTNCVTGFPPG